jgi:hypothetical protein
VKRKKPSFDTDPRATEIGSLAIAIVPRYLTMPARSRDAYDRFNAIVRADGSGIRLSSSTKAGAAFWCSPEVDDFWLRRFAIPCATEGDQPMPAEKSGEPKVQDWPGWEVHYVEHLVRDRMLPRSQQAIMEQTARMSRGEASFLCLVKFRGIWLLEAGRRDDDDILTRAAAGGLDPFALAPGGE